MVNPNRFYTYAYLREDKTPYYIGKGKDNRAYRKFKGEIIKPPKDKSRIIFLKQNLTEEEAFKHEKYMISVFGRKDLGTGILRNRTNGGEGPSGVMRSEKTRRKQSEKMKGRYAGENHPNYGKKQSKETRRKIGEANKGKKHSQETRRKQSEVMKGKYNGKTHPNCGKLHSTQSKNKISKKLKGMFAGEKNPNYGKKWWNDGEENEIFSIECPPNWYAGRSKEVAERKGKKFRGRKWWNDRKGNTKMSVECPGEGWIIGRGTNYK